MFKKIILFLLAFGFISGLELYIRTFHPEDLFHGSGLYFQEYKSDDMMQALPIEQLLDAPLESLLYLHIQPPMFDTIRAFLAMLPLLEGSRSLLLAVDGRLYAVWAMLYALMAVLVFVWIQHTTGSSRIAAVAYVLWLIHPGALAMATLLESTMLSSILTTWLLYELWRFSRQEGSKLRLSVATILLFLTRTVFQWYFIPILLMALCIAGASRKSIFMVIIPISLVVTVFLFKQYVLFATLSTTTFTGEHKLGLIQYHPTVDDINRYTAIIDYKYPDPAKEYSSKYNNEQQAITNLVYDKIFSERLICCFWESMRGFAVSINQNIRDFWRPTSQYGNFIYLDRLYWRDAYEFIFSKVFILPLALSIAFWFSQNMHCLRIAYRSIATAFVAVYILMIILIGNRYEWVEANRLKFLLEPSLYVFVVTQFVLALRWIRSYSMVKPGA
jgi:hypothetical protein